jgi:hypothetical protein
MKYSQFLETTSLREYPYEAAISLSSKEVVSKNLE